MGVIPVSTARHLPKAPRDYAVPEDYTEEVAARTAHVWARVQGAIAPEEWSHLAPLVDEILQLKRARNAVILAHNYQTRDIYHCVADIVGDSLALARSAQEAKADVIVMAGVHFMAETAKLMNPGKTVLIPDTAAGCSLAESITAADVRALRAQYPGVPVVTYVNTSAAVKAESDVCCTSANARQVVEALGTERAILIPDEFLARNVAAETHVEIITWAGRCEVHERFTGDQVAALRREHPETQVIAHPECPPDVIAAADFSGSTSGMERYIAAQRPQSVALITECSMADNLRGRHPDTQFVSACRLCPHMKRITLDKIAEALRDLRHEVTVPEETAARARRAVQRMLEIGRG